MKREGQAGVICVFLAAVLYSTSLVEESVPMVSPACTPFRMTVPLMGAVMV